MRLRSGLVVDAQRAVVLSHRCSGCGKSFEKKRGLGVHKGKSRCGPNYKRPPFVTAAHLKRVLGKITRSQGYKNKCDCGERFKTLDGLKVHKREYCRIPPAHRAPEEAPINKCGICERIFKNPQALRCHVNFSRSCRSRQEMAPEAMEVDEVEDVVMADLAPAPEICIWCETAIPADNPQARYEHLNAFCLPFGVEEPEPALAVCELCGEVILPGHEYFHMAGLCNQDAVPPHFFMETSVWKDYNMPGPSTSGYMAGPSTSGYRPGPSTSGYRPGPSTSGYPEQDSDSD